MQRDRGRGPGATRKELAREIIAAISMFEDSGNECRFCDRGNDTHGSATARTELQFDIEHPVKALHPVHRGRGFGLAGLPGGALAVVRRRC